MESALRSRDLSQVARHPVLVVLDISLQNRDRKQLLRAKFEILFIVWREVRGPHKHTV